MLNYLFWRIYFPTFASFLCILVPSWNSPLCDIYFLYNIIFYLPLLLLIAWSTFSHTLWSCVSLPYVNVYLYFWLNLTKFVFTFFTIWIMWVAYIYFSNVPLSDLKFINVFHPFGDFLTMWIALIDKRRESSKNSECITILPKNAESEKGRMTSMAVLYPEDSTSQSFSFTAYLYIVSILFSIVFYYRKKGI